MTKTWTIADRACREITADNKCDPCAVGSRSQPLPLKYGDLYCEPPDGKKDYVICFDATPDAGQLTCKPCTGTGTCYGWNYETHAECECQTKTNAAFVPNADYK